MTRSEMIRRLHEMVQQLADVPEDWFDEGIYPLHKVTFVRKDTGAAITLVVGVEGPEE